MYLGGLEERPVETNCDQRVWPSDGFTFVENLRLCVKCGSQVSEGPQVKGVPPAALVQTSHDAEAWVNR